jgi:protein-S-isoprenylcysteine O-methyltransferase Ste14
VVDVFEVAYFAGAGLVAAFAFRDAPRRVAGAWREGRVTRSRAYHALNLASVLVVAAWLGCVLAGFDRGLLPHAGWVRWVRGIATGVAWLGFGLTAWARWVMGAAFAPTAAVPASGQIVDEGPFGHVRHPFYVGLLVALFAGSGALDSVATLGVGVVMVPLVVSIARLEEEHLVDALGEAYEAYRERVPAWVPRR